MTVLACCGQELGLKCLREHLMTITENRWGLLCPYCRRELFGNVDGRLHLTPSGQVFQRPATRDLVNLRRFFAAHSLLMFKWLRDWVAAGTPAIESETYVIWTPETETIFEQETIASASTHLIHPTIQTSFLLPISTSFLLPIPHSYYFTMATVSNENRTRRNRGPNIRWNDEDIQMITEWLCKCHVVKPWRQIKRGYHHAIKI